MDETRTPHCAFCGDSHDGFLTDWGYRMPDEVWTLPQSDQARVIQDGDTCVFEGRCFIRCLLPLPFRNSREYFGWGIWVEVNAAGFDQYHAFYSGLTDHARPIAGWIANQLPGYDRALGERVQIRFGSADRRPTAELPKHSRLHLAADQHEGIDSTRYHELLSYVGFLAKRRLH